MAQEDADFVHDTDGARLAYRGRWLDLTRYEYRLLALLVQHPGRIFARSQLMDLVWHDSLDTVDRTVDTHVKTLEPSSARSTPLATRSGPIAAWATHSNHDKEDKGIPCISACASSLASS
jgi:hypothetical protein